MPHLFPAVPGLLTCTAMLAAAAALPTPKAVKAITPEGILSHIRTLASDEYEGRAPGSAGEQKAPDYLTAQCRSLKLAPGNRDGTYLQPVPLWGITSGGMYTNFAVKGETPPPTEIVPAAKQREMLGLFLDDVDPASLAIPESLLVSLTVPVDAGGREEMESSTGYAFDHLAAARTIAGLVFDQIFEPETAARLIGFADRQANALTLPETIDACAKKVFGAPAPAGMLRSMQRQTQRVFIDAVMTLGASPSATPDVKAVVMASLAAVRTQVAGLKDSDSVNEVSLRQMERDLTRYAQTPTTPKKSSAAAPVMAPI
ncbi:MAG: zinc-dependent metalloprotease [Acidobacteriota bacterium]|nr:zinc-dependent metalloprotease [Acidobacteriota bacterium]